MAERRIVLPIKGMECGACAATVQRRLALTQGVRQVHVNFTTGEATVFSVDGGPQATDLVKAVREAGYDCGGAKVTFDLAGLHHASSIARLEGALGEARGVVSARANQATELLEVEYLPSLATTRELELHIAAVGFSIAEPIEEPDPIEREWVRQTRATQGLAWKFTLAIAVTLIAVVASMPLAAESTAKGGDIIVRLLTPLDAALRGAWPQLYQLDHLWIELGLLLVTLLVMFQSGGSLYAAARRNFRFHTADVNTLVAVGTGVLFLYSAVAVAVPAIWPAAGFPSDVHFDSVNGIIAFVLLGRLIEARANARAARPVHGLMALEPTEATVCRGAESQKVAAYQVRVGDHVAVSPGESIPVDGTVVAGDSDIDRSMFPGGPESVSVGPGSGVMAGAINLTALLEVRAHATGRKTALGQTVRIVEEAQFRKSVIQKRVDRLVGVLAPIVIAVALAAVILWMLLGQSSSAILAMLAFVTVVVVAAPSAVSLSGPAAVRVATGRAAELGAVIRGGDVIETMQQVDTLIFGKTGTITEGTPTVTHVVGAKRADGTTVNPAEILQVAAAVEARSGHLLATAILASAKEKSIDVPGVERFVEMPGRGVRGIVGRFLVEAISVRHARERSLQLGRLTKDIDRHVLAGRTPVVVVVNDVVRGLIILADPTKANAKKAIAQLGKMGYTLFMLSGDSKATAQLVAKETGIDRVVAEVEPRNKADEIKRFQEDGRVVAVIADGIEDAQALAQADVGIAIGAGSEIAMQASDVTLPGSDLQGVVTAVQIARQTARTIRSNLMFAILYHLLGIPLAVGVLYPVTGLLLTPMIAAAAAGVAPWIVVANGLRLGSFNPTTTT
jgi:Cu+-exporting ATPase